MSLTKQDLLDIRALIRDEVRSAFAVELEPIKNDIAEIKGRLMALENDVKEIYSMISRASVWGHYRQIFPEAFYRREAPFAKHRVTGHR